MTKQEEFQMRLGEELTRLRDRKGLSQAELARQAGLHRNSLYRYEAGADIPVHVFMRLCKALDVHMIDVLETILPDARRRIAEANGLELKGTKK